MYIDRLFDVLYVVHLHRLLYFMYITNKVKFIYQNAVAVSGGKI